jgi:cytochrome c5
MSYFGAGSNLKQFLLTVFFSLVLPVIIIVSLVRESGVDNRPVPQGADLDMLVASRLQKVGAVSFGAVNKELRTGEQVFKAQCTTCHLTGAAGSPKFGDAAAWAPRIKTGFDALVVSATKGKGNMGAQSGGEFTDFEISRGVVYMANAGGAKFAEPKAPAK